MKGVFRSDASTVDWCRPSSCILPPVAPSAYTVSWRACSFFTATILPLFLLSCLTVAKENLICLLLGICSSKLSLHGSLLSSKQAYAIVSRQRPGSLTSRLKLLAQDTLLLPNFLTVYTPLSSLSHSFYFSHDVIAFLPQMTLPPSLSLLYLFFQNHPRCHLCLASCSPPRQLEHGSVSNPCLLPCLTFNLDCLFIHWATSCFKAVTVWESSCSELRWCWCRMEDGWEVGGVWQWLLPGFLWGCFSLSSVLSPSHTQVTGTFFGGPSLNTLSLTLSLHLVSPAPSGLAQAESFIFTWCQPPFTFPFSLT